MKQSKAIVFDIDGVLADFEYSFCEKFGNEHRDYTNLSERYPEQSELVDEFISSPYTYSDLEPIFGGWVLLNQARDRGYKIILMTSRPLGTRAITEQWLKQYNTYYDDLFFTKNKAEAIRTMNSRGRSKIIALIDDLPVNFEKLPKGVSGISWEQPWNSDYYPKARYLISTMQVEIKLDTASPWVNFWTGK